MTPINNLDAIINDESIHLDNYWMEYFAKNPVFESKSCYVNLDGIIDKNKWDESEPKVLCLFKESYRSKHNSYLNNYIYPLIKELKEYRPWGMWKKVNEWLKVIFDYSDRDVNCLPSIATINIIKEIPTTSNASNNMIGNTRTTKVRLIEACKNHFNGLVQQIEDINPSIIICGYTFKYLMRIFYYKSNGVQKISYEALLSYFKNKNLISSYTDAKTNCVIYKFMDKYTVLSLYHPSYNNAKLTNPKIITTLLHNLKSL